MARNRRQRATKARRSKRNAQRTTENALRRGLAASQIPDPPSPPRTKARQQPMIERYLARGLITDRQYRAADSLYKDWYGSLRQGYVKTATVDRVSFGHSDPTMRQVECHHRYMAAIQTLGLERSPIVIHICLHDHTAEHWARNHGRCSIGDAMDMLRDGLDALDRHYADARKAERQREMEIA